MTVANYIASQAMSTGSPYSEAAFISSANFLHTVLGFSPLSEGKVVAKTRQGVRAEHRAVLTDGNTPG